MTNFPLMNFRVGMAAEWRPATESVGGGDARLESDDRVDGWVVRFGEVGGSLALGVGDALGLCAAFNVANVGHGPGAPACS